VVAALTRKEPRPGYGPERIRYIQVGIAAGEVAAWTTALVMLVRR
jgi:hypothetical protein